MRHLPLVFLAPVLLIASALRADTIPYATPGTPVAATVLTATSSGVITGFFAGQSAGDDSVIRLVDLTSGYTSGYFFANHSTVLGSSANFGSGTTREAIRS